MKPVVAYSRRLSPLTQHERVLEERFGVELREVPLWSREMIAENAADATAIMVGATEPLDRTALESLPLCRVVVRRGVGVNNVDLAAATELGIPVAYVPDASVQEVSDHALALLLTLERRVPTLDSLVREGRWNSSSSDMSRARTGMRRLSELTLGVVGFGRIGRALAHKATPLFARIVVFDPYSDDASAAEFVDFATLLHESDAISVHAPLTEDTRHLFDAQAFTRLKPGCTIVNTSRGGLIDTGALVAALRSGAVDGAGLDVTEVEPLPADSALLRLQNVIVTGHSAAMSDSSVAELRKGAVEAVVDVLDGRLPRFVANPEVTGVATCRVRPEGGVS